MGRARMGRLRQTSDNGGGELELRYTLVVVGRNLLSYTPYLVAASTAVGRSGTGGYSGNSDSIVCQSDKGCVNLLRLRGHALEFHTEDEMACA